MEHPFTGVSRDFGEAGADFRFGSSVAMAGLLLRKAEGTEEYGFADVTRNATDALGSDPHGQRSEFIELMARLSSRTDREPDR